MSTDPRDLPVTVPEEVADGVWAFAQQDGSWWINTAGFVVGSDRVTSIDACATEARTRHLLNAISQVTDRPVRALVNTHAHGDHTYGNCLFTEATILAHERCREDMRADTLLGQPIPLWDHLPDWGNLQKAYPTVTFTDRLRLWVDDQPVELVYAGGPAHTRGDVVAWLPERRVLFTGDLAFNGGMPMVVAGSVTGALKSVDWLRDFDAGRGRAWPRAAMRTGDLRHPRAVLPVRARYRDRRQGRGREPPGRRPPDRPRRVRPPPRQRTNRAQPAPGLRRPGRPRRGGRRRRLPRRHRLQRRATAPLRRLS